MSRASGYGILQKGVDNMITGQIIQTSIDELKAITKVDLGVYDLNGSVMWHLPWREMTSRRI